MTSANTRSLLSNRYFSPLPAQRELASELYQTIVDLPLVCPHGHVDPRLFADPDYNFGSPTELLLIPDHYVFRMLYSQGISLESLGIPRTDGGQTETDHRRIWQTFAEHYYLFQGTPTGIWLTDELDLVFGVNEKISAKNAQDIYDHIDQQLRAPEFNPRQLFHQFNIEVLCTTDSAIDTLEHHRAIQESDWQGRILPTFRPDSVLNLNAPGWKNNIAALGEVSGIDVIDYCTFVQALEQRRTFFKSMGATATDHGAYTAYTEILSTAESDAIFQRALQQVATEDDATRFTGHMLIEMARMSTEDGLVMQLHIGSFRNHNSALFDQFGPDAGADIPIAIDFTRDLLDLLNAHGNDSRFAMILFCLDETTYARELAPLAGHYPAVKLGPPWWFHDSINGIRRYFDQVMETAGIYNTAGFNDDTRAYPSIPVRHDVWRRASADWVAGLQLSGLIDEEDARMIVRALAYDLAKQSYRL
jgi:glucuronate isomerase